MSVAEILAELPRLSAEERAEILHRLCDLEEAGGPTAGEKSLLDNAQAEYEADRFEGIPWQEVEARLRGEA